MCSQGELLFNKIIFRIPCQQLSYFLLYLIPDLSHQERGNKSNQN